MRISQAYLDAHGITQADVDEGRVVVPLMGGESEGNTDYGYNQSGNRVWNTPTGFAPGTTPGGNFPGSGLPTGGEGSYPGDFTTNPDGTIAGRNGPSGLPGPPATPPPPSNLSIFTDTVRGQIPKYFGAADTMEQDALESASFLRGKGVGGAGMLYGAGMRESGAYGDIARGNDPRFAAYQQGQFALMGQEEQGQLGAARDMFASRGLQGSTAALNAGNRVRTQFGNQRQALAGQIGMQQMGRQDDFLGRSFGAERQGISSSLGFSVGTEQLANQTLTGGLGQSLDARSAGVETAALPPTLDIAQQAAAGGGGGGGGANGLFSGLFSNLGL